MAHLDTQQHIDMQRRDWNRVAPAWEKWDRLLDENLAFINYRLVGDARLRPGHRVLDLGSGTGYPAVLAAQAVGPKGEVVGLDVADDMLEAARRKAKALGLANVAFRPADVTTLPFDARSFDAVISRFCLMFLPDVPKAVAEVARVLKPGGYVAAAVWSSPDKNPFGRASIDVIKTFIDVPTPAPDQPGIFRLAPPGDLLGMMTRAGLTGLGDEEVIAESPFASPQEFLDNLLDIAAPIQNLMAKLTAAQQEAAKEGIKRAVEPYRRGTGVALPMAIRVVTARKPA
ncbi:MAG: class I SAM-dependent methyltransferase [Nitrospirota bacterium]